MAKVWIVLQQRAGKVSRSSWEAVAAGQRLAAALGGDKAEAVVVGSGVSALADEVAAADLAAVHLADHANLADYTPGATIGALAPAIAEAKPDWVLFPHTYQTVDYFARLAQELGAGLLPEVTGFEEPAAADGVVWERPMLGGKLLSRVRAKGGGPTLVSVQAGSFQGDTVARGGSAEVRELAVDPERAKPDREILGIEEVAGEQVDLSRAEVIVAVGRGVGGEDKMGVIRELAAALGAEIAASRPVVDNGWLARDRQIGSSGQTVAPKLYVAAGISGAIQHVVGMKGSGTIVAINKDPSAPIFNLAHYGIAADLHEVLPALIEAIREAKG